MLRDVDGTNSTYVSKLNCRQFLQIMFRIRNHIKALSLPEFLNACVTFSTLIGVQPVITITHDTTKPFPCQTSQSLVKVPLILGRSREGVFVEVSCGCRNSGSVGNGTG